MNEQQAQEIIHYLATLANYAMLMNDNLERLLEIQESKTPETTARQAGRYDERQPSAGGGD